MLLLSLLGSPTPKARPLSQPMHNLSAAICCFYCHLALAKSSIYVCAISCLHPYSTVEVLNPCRGLCFVLLLMLPWPRVRGILRPYCRADPVTACTSAAAALLTVLEQPVLGVQLLQTGPRGKKVMQLLRLCTLGQKLLETRQLHQSDRRRFASYCWCVLTSTALLLLLGSPAPSCCTARHSPTHCPPEDAGGCAEMPGSSPVRVGVVLLPQEPLILHLLTHHPTRDAYFLASGDHLSGAPRWFKGTPRTLQSSLNVFALCSSEKM